MGIAGAGNSGTVACALLAPRIAEQIGWHQTMGLAAIPAVLVLIAFRFLAKEPPAPAKRLTLRAFGEMLGENDTWRLCALYAVTFGGFVGLSSFLPIFFHDQYGLSKVDAASLAAIGGAAGSFVRPFGGHLADRFGGTRVLTVVYGLVAPLLLILSGMPSLTVAAIGFPLVMGVLGFGNGAIFQLVGLRFRARIGVVTGLVGRGRRPGRLHAADGARRAARQHGRLRRRAHARRRSSRWRRSSASACCARCGDAAGPPKPPCDAVKTGCPYCGVGCGLVAEVRDGRLHAVRGDEEHPVNRGLTCRKPLALPEASRSADRALTPQLREDATHRFRDATWDDGARHVASRPAGAPDRPEEIAFYISGQLLTEDYYAVNKLAKGYLRTNNVDSNSRLCMSSAVAGYDAVFGADGPPPAYADLELTDCILLLGSNASACHPILWGRIRAAQERGAKLIVVDPRRTDAADGRRHPPADQARHRPRAAQRADRRARARAATGRPSAPPTSAASPAEGIARAAAAVRRAARRWRCGRWAPTSPSRASRSTARC